MSEASRLDGCSTLSNLERTWNEVGEKAELIFYVTEKHITFILESLFTSSSWCKARGPCLT